MPKRYRLSLLCLLLAVIILIPGCAAQSETIQSLDESSQTDTTQIPDESAKSDTSEKLEDEKAQYEISKLKIYDADGACTFDVSYEYNEEGKLIHQVEYLDQSANKIEMFLTYPESNWQITTYIDKDTGKRTQSDEAWYNDAGNIVTMSSYFFDENGSQDDKYSQFDYFYDETDHLIQKEIYDTTKIGGNVTSKQITQYTYDGKGNCIAEICTYVRDGQEDRVWEDCSYEYDKNGNRIRETNAVVDKYTASPIVYTYNEKNQLMKKEEYIATTPDVLKDYGIYEYDENNNLLTFVRYSADDQITSRMEYEYIRIGDVSVTTETAASNMSLYQRWHVAGTAASFISFQVQADTSAARCEITDFDLSTQQEQTNANTSTWAEITDTTIEISYRPDKEITYTYVFQKDGTLKLTDQETGMTFSMRLP